MHGRYWQNEYGSGPLPDNRGMTTASTVLLFPDRRRDGAFPVIDADDLVVAHIVPKWSRSRFTATDGEGGPLCQGAAGALGISRVWRATGADGSPLVTITNAFFAARADVELARGGSYKVRGSSWRRSFTMTTLEGVPVLEAIPRTSAISFHPHDYEVRVLEPVFELAELVALVQTWRMVRAAEVAGAASGATAAAIASG